MKTKVEKTQRIDEFLNGLTTKKIGWIEKENENFIYIITVKGIESQRYVFDKRDGYLIYIQTVDKKSLN